MELCDLQNEQAKELIKKPPEVKPYAEGEGPNPLFYDSGIGDLKRIEAEKS